MKNSSSAGATDGSAIPPSPRRPSASGGRVEALLRRCCLGRSATDCGESCAHDARPPTPPQIIRDPGPLRDSGVLARSVRRDLTTLAGGEPRTGNAVRVLSDGVDSFGAMLDLVRTSEHDVRFENFIFRADAVGATFASELRARADADVAVRVLHDPVGSLMGGRLPADLLFRRSAVEVRMFNVAWPTRSVRARGRDHRKLVVADGHRMVAGGICLADPWAGNCVRHCTWRDSAVLVEGPAAEAASHAFDQAWRHGRRLVSPTPRGSHDRGPVTPRAMPAEGSVPVRLVADMGPVRRTLPVLERVLEAAGRDVLVTSPYFLPPDRLVRALGRVAARGVEVSILIPGRNNHPVVGLAAEERLLPLLELGVSVFRWSGAMIHAKSVVVDGVWTLVGSSNLDALSLLRNAELNVEIHGPAVGAVMVGVFRRDCANATRLTLDDWRRRGSPRRLAGRAAAMLRPWL